MKNLAVVHRESMSDRVRQILLDRILDGTYAPGMRLVELKIARELNTSQGPVREALRELEAMQIVRTEPYRGTRVREVSGVEMREAYQVRAILEQFAAEEAAPRLKGDVRDLQALVEKVRAAARNRDIESYARYDIPFHRRIVEGSGNAILLRTWDSLAFDVRIRVFLSRFKLDLSAAQEIHQSIVDALALGDGSLAGKLLRQHYSSIFEPGGAALPGQHAKG